MLFWTRLEMSQSFVLSELQPILFVRQNRLEMENCARRVRDIVRLAKTSGIQTAHPAEPSGTQYARLWPRVEMVLSFVLCKLRHILHVCQNRVEMRETGGNSGRKLPGGIYARAERLHPRRPVPGNPPRGSRSAVRRQICLK